MKLGIEKTAMIRVRAGISYALTEAMDEGHCGLPTDELVAAGRQAAGGGAGAGPGRRSSWSCEAGDGDRRHASADEPCVFLAGLYRAEQVIAERLQALRPGTACPGPAIDPDKALPWVEEQTGLALAPKPASRRSGWRCSSKVLVITGGPGVGKTTIVNSILRILRAKGVRAAALRADRPRGQAHDARAPGSRPRPSTGCWRSTPRAAASSATRTTRSTATCWWSTRPRWSTCC